MKKLSDRKLKELAFNFRYGIIEDQPSIQKCMMVSAPLQGFLRAIYDIQTKLEEVDFGHCNHVFLRLPDDRILDATADQFHDMPKVYLGEMPETYKQMMKEED